MDAADIDVLSRHPVPRHRLSVEDYHRLGAAGVLGEADRVELLEGQLVDMSPIGPGHAYVVNQLSRILIAAVGERAWVSVQNPVTLDSGSEPQPDIVLAQPPAGQYLSRHPRSDDVLLLIEVADTSFEVDSGAKLEIYAKAGIREFWIVDLTTNHILVHRDPRDGAYRSVVRVAPSGTQAVEALPGVAIPAAPLFP